MSGTGGLHYFSDSDDDDDGSGGGHGNGRFQQKRFAAERRTNRQKNPGPFQHGRCFA